MTPPTPVVHLELHTPNLGRAAGFYSDLLDWRPQAIHAGGRDYTALDLGGEIGGGAVECGTKRGLWLPYASVADVVAATERARGLGASVLLEPRDGRAGRRSVVSTPDGGEIAFWEPKAR
jgi:predicted enzyme related to lactoylglutathione lyase